MAKIKITQEQYERLFKPLLENKIDPNRVDKNFKKDLDEEEKITQEPLDITKKDPQLGSISSQKRIPPSKGIETNVKMPNVNEGEEKSKKVDMTKEVQSLVKFLYRQENELSDFLKEKGISFEDIKDKLKGKIIERNGKYELSKSFGTKEETYRTLENMLREMTGTYEEVEENYPAGAEHDSRAPYNRENPVVPKADTDYEVIDNNNHLAIVRDTTTNEFFMVPVYEINTEFQDLQPVEITNYIENSRNGLKDIPEVEPITPETIDNLVDIYNLDKSLIKSLEWVKGELGSANLEEMSTGSAMGIGGVGTPSNSPVGPMAMIKKPIQAEGMTATPDTVGPYDAPGLANVSREGKFKKNGKKPKAFKVPQWAGGMIVNEQPDCSKLNNNKEAQNGGCNSGASSFNFKAQKGSVNAPSLGENKNYSVYKIEKTTKSSLLESFRAIKEQSLDEDLELRQIGDRIEIFSNNPDAKKAGNETFYNKDAFKQNNMFGWDKDRKVWYTSVENRDAAVNMIDQLNKSKFGATEDYTIDKIVHELEGLQRELETAKVDGASCATGTSCTSTKDLHARIKQFMEELIAETDSEKVAAKIKEYLDFRKNFHKYSLHNLLLIMLQRRDATHVASLKAWNKVGRRIKKGSKGIAIFVPVFDNSKTRPQIKVASDNEDEEDTIIKGGNPLRYIVGYVYDVSDTDGADIPQQPQWWTNDDDNEKAMKLVFFTEEAVKANGIKLTAEPSSGGERGYSANGIINIPPTLKGTGKLSTLVHEFAHELLHWPNSKFYIGDEAKTDKAVLELQAESISYVVLRHYDMGEISTLNHANYLAGWGKGKGTTAGEKLQKELEIVTKVGQYIINAIDAVAEKSEKKNR